MNRRTLLASAVSVSSVCGCLGFSDENDNHPYPAEPYRLDPGTYDLIVIVRNDDPAPGHAMDALEAVDEIFIKEGIPVTHAVVPAMGDPLESDSDFCEYFRTRVENYPGLFDFSLHGYAHEANTDFHGTSEFGGLSTEEQHERIESGLRLLENCIDESIDTFVPPFNTYDQTTVEQLVALDVPIISGGEWFTQLYFEHSDIPFTIDGALHIPNTHEFVSDWETGAFYSLDEMISEFDRVYEEGDLFVQLMHFQYFTTDERLEQLQSLMQHMKETAGVGFMTLASFGNAYLDGAIERVDGGWRYDPDDLASRST